MENVLGIIAEYNPFHNGHLYHLNKSKKLADSEFSIAVMSGNFVERGETSIVDKWTKTEMALLCGVDLVIELPTIYAISSSENFALGSIKILNSLNIVDTISFGSECGNIEVLNSIAEVLVKEPKKYTLMLKHELDKGLSFPKARENALLLYLNDIRTYANVLSGSNNILGIEYIKALKFTKSNIFPLTVNRKNVGYNDKNSVDGFASSTAIRQMVLKREMNSIKASTPSKVSDLLLDKMKYGNIVPSIAAFEKQIIYKLRTMSLWEIAELQDVSEGLEHSFKNAANSCNDITTLIKKVKSKRYTQTRIQRILLYALLDITKEKYTYLTNVTPYIRVLGMNKNGKQLLSKISELNPKLRIITSVKHFMDNCPDKKVADRTLREMLELDIFATNIYTLGYEYDSQANLDYTQKIVVV